MLAPRTENAENTAAPASVRVGSRSRSDCWIGKRRVWVRLFDRLKGQARAPRYQPVARVAAPVSPIRPPSASQHSIRPTYREGEWLAPHSTRTIAGYTINGGLLYVGSRL